MNITLPHWDAAEVDHPAIDLNVIEDNRQLVITEVSDEIYARSVILETRNDGTLAVIIYGRDEYDPLIILLPQTGKPKVYE